MATESALPSASTGTGGTVESTLLATIDVLPPLESTELGTGAQLALAIQTATVELTLNGTEVTTTSAPFDGFVAPNLKSGYLTDGNTTINFLCPDLSNGAGSGTGGTPPPVASPSASPATEPSGSPATSSSP